MKNLFQNYSKSFFLAWTPSIIMTFVVTIFASSGEYMGFRIGPSLQPPATIEELLFVLSVSAYVFACVFLIAPTYFRLKEAYKKHWVVSLVASLAICLIPCLGIINLALLVWPKKEL